MFELGIIMAIIMCFAELVKKIKLVYSTYIPILNIAFGVIICVSYYTYLPIREAIIQGVILGLTSSFIYFFIKKCITKFSKFVKS